MATAPSQKKKARSPSYPAISLPEALERARVLYREERRNPAPVDTILDHWGYKPGSGNGVLAVAALRKYGLLEYIGASGSRQGRLTDLALKIILDDREVSLERDEALRQAAFTPAIHSDVRRRYPNGLPSDGTLKHYLTYERRFTESAAQLLIQEIKDTLAFIGTAADEAMPPDEGEPAPEQTRAVVTPSAPSFPEARSLQVPLPRGGSATLVTSRPLTIDEWATLRTVIDAMEASFVDPYTGTDDPAYAGDDE